MLSKFSESCAGEGGCRKEGVGFCWNKFLHTSGHGGCFNDTRRYSMVWHAPFGKVLLVSVYGYSGHPDMSVQMISQTVRQASATGMPFLLMGDMNVSGEELVRQWPGIGDLARILNFGPTCHTSDGPSAIDYMIMCRGFETGGMRQLTFPSTFATHTPVAIVLPGKDSEVLVFKKKVSC